MMLIAAPDLPAWFPKNPYDNRADASDNIKPEKVIACIAYELALKNVHDKITERTELVRRTTNRVDLPEWFPTDPFPKSLGCLTNNDYLRMVPDPAERTGISWLLMGDAYRIALADVHIKLLRMPYLLNDYDTINNL